MISHLPTIREGETLRVSMISSRMIPSDEEMIHKTTVHHPSLVFVPTTASLEMPNYNRPEHISKTFGGGNLDTVQAYQNIVSLLVDVQKYEEALEVCHEILDILWNLFGTQKQPHIAIATTYQNMGDILERFGRNQKAMECYQEALRIRLKVLGGHKEDADGTVAIHKTLSNLKLKMMMMMSNNSTTTEPSQ